MKNQYQNPEIEVLLFNLSDVILTESGGTPVDTGAEDGDLSWRPWSLQNDDLN